MKTVAEKIRELREREAKVKAMGGAKAVEKQHAGGKLTARERLDLFFDPGTFQETDMFVTHRCVNFGMEKIEIPADGVITGQLERHRTDILVSTVDTDADLYDSTSAWRERALAGILHSGSLVEVERSENRTTV